MFIGAECRALDELFFVGSYLVRSALQVEHTNLWYPVHLNGTHMDPVPSLQHLQLSGGDAPGPKTDPPPPAGDGAASGAGLVQMQLIWRLRSEGWPGDEGFKFVRHMNYPSET